MDSDQNTPAFREAVAVFHEPENLQAAIDDLMTSGFDGAELSLLASEKVMETKLGGISWRELGDHPDTPRRKYVAPETIGAVEGGIIGGLAYLGGVTTAGVIALAGGPLTVIAVGAVLAGGAGGLVGTGLAALVGDKQADYLGDHLGRGGMLLWVRTWDTERELRALEILRRHAGTDVHIKGEAGRETPGSNQTGSNQGTGASA